MRPDQTSASSEKRPSIPSVPLPAPELIHVLRLPDFDRADAIDSQALLRGNGAVHASPF
jgi:hypothetical protein